MPVQSPLVSVIVPAYKGQQRIARAVNSIFQQDYGNWEIVIISDDLSDYERVLAEQGIRSDKIQYYSTGGIATGEGNARNVGLLNARGEFVVQLDCDDVFHPERISRLLPLTQKYGAAISNIEMIDEETGQTLTNYNAPVENEYVLPEQVIRCSFHTMNVAMFDRNRITHSYYRLERYADYVFLMQMFNAVPRIGYCKEPLYKYYKYHGSVTNFSDNPDDIAASFTKLAEIIKHQTTTGDIHLTDAVLKDIIHKDMDLWIGAQAYFAAAARKNPSAKFHEIIGAFLQSWPLPAALLAAT